MIAILYEHGPLSSMAAFNGNTYAYKVNGWRALVGNKNPTTAHGLTSIYSTRQSIKTLYRPRLEIGLYVCRLFLISCLCINPSTGVHRNAKTNLLGSNTVKTTGRFVQKENSRVGHQFHADVDSFAFTARNASLLSAPDLLVPDGVSIGRRGQQAKQTAGLRHLKEDMRKTIIFGFRPRLR